MVRSVREVETNMWIPCSFISYCCVVRTVRRALADLHNDIGCKLFTIIVNTDITSECLTQIDGPVGHVPEALGKDQRVINSKKGVFKGLRDIGKSITWLIRMWLEENIDPGCPGSRTSTAKRHAAGLVRRITTYQMHGTAMQPPLSVSG